MPQEPLRLDHLALRGLEHVCRAYLEPRVDLKLWENGLGWIAEKLIERSAIPKDPVISVQVGNIEIPVRLIGAGLRYARLLPPQEVARGAGA